MAEEPESGLEQRLRELEQRVASLEAEVADRPARRLVPPPAPPPPTAAAVPAPPPPPTGAPVPPPRPGAPSAASWQPRPVARPDVAGWARDLSTEVVLKWAGLLLLFLAAVFLVSTAISRGWIGPELQLLGVVTLGASLVGAGLRPQLRSGPWGKSLVAVGVAVWFTSCGAPSQWLDLGGVGWGLAGAGLTGAVGVALARLIDSRLVAFTTFFGLVVVPLWVSAVDEYGAIAYLVAMIIVVAVFHGLYVDRDWPLLYITVALVSGLLSFAGAFEDDQSHTTLQVLLIALALLHWLAPAAHARLNPEAGDDWAEVAGRLQLTAPTWIWGATMILHDFDADHAGFLVALAVGAAASASSLAMRPYVPQWLWTSQLMGAGVVLSVGLLSWLEGSTLVAALAVQALAMLALSRWVGDGWFTGQSILTASLAWLGGLGLTIEAIEQDATWGADTVHGVVFAVTIVVGWFRRQNEMGRILALAGYAASLVWVASVLIHLGQGQLLTSIVWAALGVTVVVWGLSTRQVGVARVGLATLAVTVAKLLTVDLAEVDTFWRAGLFFVIGLGFLWLSASIPRLVGSPGEEQPQPGD